MEWVFTAFIFFGVIAVTALLFGGWVVFTIVRLILRGISALFDAPAPPTNAGTIGGRAGRAMRQSQVSHDQPNHRPILPPVRQRHATGPTRRRKARSDVVTPLRGVAARMLLMLNTPPPNPLP